MQYNTLMTHWMTGTHYRYTDSFQPGNTAIIRTFFASGDIKITIISRTDKNAVIYTDKVLDLFDRIGEVRDRSGELAMPSDYRVNSVVPTVNAMGFSDGYAYKVSAIPDASIQEVVPV